MIVEWALGLAGSLVIAGAAYWKRSLSASGFLAAVALGTVMYALGNAAWFGTLIAFFLSSTLLSKLKRARKAVAESGYAKSGRRDAGQVAANGGLGLLLCMANAIWPDPMWWALFVGVMATVNADTWATEIGGLSRARPRSIITGKRVAAGTSGGITGLGLGASVLGGLFIGAVAALLAGFGEPYGGQHHLPGGSAGPLLALSGIGAVSGLLGSLADSWLGAVLQVMYRCTVCGQVMEKHIHCERKADHARGIRWMTNDVVNAISSLAGGAVSLVLFALW